MMMMLVIVVCFFQQLVRSDLQHLVPPIQLADDRCMQI